MTRRTLVGAGLAMLAAPAAVAAPGKTRITTYRSPTCGCCGKWVDQARAAGFAVTVVATEDLVAVKRKLGVPDRLLSCHTSVAGGYVVEGHVPFAAVRKLLSQKPKIRGIGVPGMPLGSPGMEAPAGQSEPFKVYAFDGSGKITVFA